MNNMNLYVNIFVNQLIFIDYLMCNIEAVVETKLNKYYMLG